MRVLNKHGATSVIIILLMVVLMVFGLTILTMTLSNQTLSNKKIDWINSYYELESKVAIALADLDGELTGIKNRSEDSDDYIARVKENFEVIEVDETYRLEMKVSNEDEYQKHIIVQLEIVPYKNSRRNYTIVKYSETQDLFEYEDIEFGVPFKPGDN